MRSLHCKTTCNSFPRRTFTWYNIGIAILSDHLPGLIAELSKSPVIRRHCGDRKLWFVLTFSKRTLWLTYQTSVGFKYLTISCAQNRLNNVSYVFLTSIMFFNSIASTVRSDLIFDISPSTQLNHLVCKDPSLLRGSRVMQSSSRTSATLRIDDWCTSMTPPDLLPGNVIFPLTQSKGLDHIPQSRLFWTLLTPIHAIPVCKKIWVLEYIQSCASSAGRLWYKCLRAVRVNGYLLHPELPEDLCGAMSWKVEPSSRHVMIHAYHFRTGGVKCALTGQRDSSRKCADIMVLSDNGFDWGRGIQVTLCQRELRSRFVTILWSHSARYVMQRKGYSKVINTKSIALKIAANQNDLP